MLSSVTVIKNLVEMLNPAYAVSANHKVVAKIGLVYVVPADKVLIMQRMALFNSAGAAIDVGVGNRLRDDAPTITQANVPGGRTWFAGQWDDSETDAEYIDDSIDAQDAGANDFALTTLTINDGYVVGAEKPFSALAIAVGTAEAGTPAYEYTYWNGTSWGTLTLIDTPSYLGVADTYLTFAPPTDWAATSSDQNGLPNGYYCVRCRATTAPTTAPLASTIQAYHIFRLTHRYLADNTEYAFEGVQMLFDKSGEDIYAYFGTANADNSINVAGNLVEKKAIGFTD